MRYATATFGLLAFIPSLSLAAPVIEQPRVRSGSGIHIPIQKRSSFVEDGVVNMSALVNHMALTTAKLNRGLAVYELNTGIVHSLATALGLSSRSSGSVILDDESSTLWSGNLTVGTPAQSFTVDFDTGSSDMFIPSSDCGSGCSGRTLYDQSSSTSASSLGQNFTLSYGDGSHVSGEQITDTVSIADMTVTNQTIGAASTYSASLPTYIDGLVGLGFQSISVYNQPPLFQTLMSEGQTDKSMFAFKLASGDSELYLGGTNTDLYTGDITWTDVTEEGYWQVNMDALSVSSTTITSDQTAIVDSGTTLILGDNTTVAAFYGNITGSAYLGGGAWSVPCDSIPEDASLTFGGTAFTLSQETFSLGLVKAGSSDCVGGLASTTASFWVVGDVFMQNVYSVFDAGEKRVGFATLA